MKKILRKLCPHDYVEFAPSKRKCKICGNEQWVFTKKYPKIGEAASD